MKVKILVLSIAVLALIVPAGVVSAQGTSSVQSDKVISNANSLRLSPVRTEIALDPGQSKNMTVTVQNLNPYAVRAKAIVSDFAPSTDESGTPIVILEEDGYAESHSIKRLASVTPQIVVLAPNQAMEVQVKITLPASVRPGGYYGAVRFLPADDVTTGDNNGVAIATNLGSLVLLRVNGETERKLTLESMELKQGNGKDAKTFFTSNKDIKLITRFNNQGNIQEQPFGKVQLLKSGKVVDTIEINSTDPRGNVLPESIRRFENKMNKVGNFGKYTVSANLSYTNNGELMTQKISFWVVPVSYMLGGLAALLIIGIIIFLTIKVMRLSHRGGRPRRY